MDIKCPWGAWCWGLCHLRGCSWAERQFYGIPLQAANMDLIMWKPN